MRLSALLFAAMLLAGCGSLARDKKIEEADVDEDKAPAKELEVQLPPYPQANNLVLLQAGSATAHRFYIDTSSIAIGEDAIVRYAIVAKTEGGATNVSYEGMRCDTREQKTYAFGRSDGTWLRTRDPQWQRIVLRDLKPYPFVLYREFFCASGARPVPLRQAVEALKRGVGLAQSRAIDE
jgi:hypothetical protein